MTGLKCTACERLHTADFFLLAVSLHGELWNVRSIDLCASYVFDRLEGAIFKLKGASDMQCLFNWNKFNGIDMLFDTKLGGIAYLL